MLILCALVFGIDVNAPNPPKLREANVPQRTSGLMTCPEGGWKLDDLVIRNLKWQKVVKASRPFPFGKEGVRIWKQYVTLEPTGIDTGLRPVEIKLHKVKMREEE